MMKQRRVLGVAESEKVTLFWKEMAFKNLEKSGKQLDLDVLINKQGFICKKCFYAYDKLIKKKMVGFSLYYVSNRIRSQKIQSFC